MGEWKRVKLRDCVEEVDERTTENNQYEVLTSSKSGIYSQEDYFDKQVASKDNTGYKIIKRGQFTYRSMSDNGTFTINRLENKDIGIVSPAYPVFEATNINAEYLKYFFQSEGFRKAIYNLSQGSTRTALKYKDLSNIDILLPPIEEQEKIVEILKTIDSIIEKYKSLLEEKNKFIKSQFVEMFGDPIENPKNYKIVKLSDIADYWNGLTYKPTDVNKKGTIVLRSSNIQNSQLNYQDIVRVNCNIKEKQYVKDNDILMCSRNGSTRLVGKVAVIKDIKEKMTFGAFMMIIRSEYYPYLFSYFQTDAFRNQIKYGATTTINQITENMLNKIKLPLPDKDDINQFAEIVKQIDKQNVELEKLITNYKALKKGLMQQLLTGKVRVKI